MAIAVVEERQLLKSLRWWDGFVIALCNPGFLIAFVGYTMAAVGAWGALFLWATASLIGGLQAWIYSETAAMFPDKPGGISLYAHEGWRGRFSLLGPIGAFGYWIGWSVVLSIFGKVIGDLVISKWFPATTWHFSDGVLTSGVTVSDLIGIGCIILVWFLNVYGIRPAVWFSYVTAVGLAVPLVVVMFVPYFTHHWHASNLKWSFGSSPFSLIMVWLFLNAWSAYGVEICATFAPEYKNTRRDTAIALRSAAGFCLVVFILYPLGLGGVIGAPSAATAEGQYLTGVFTTLVGSGAASFVTVCLIGSLFLSMISSTADASRALYGIARDDMTVKQLYHLNRYHVPGRAMTVDMVVNICLILFISSNVAILYMSNIGYVIAHILALTGFLLLRHDRPNWPRPIKVGSPWVAIAGLLAIANLVFLIYGVANPALAYATSFKDVWIGFGILVASVLLYVFRRLAQDRQPLKLRDEVASMPTPEQMALLHEELVVTPAPPA